MKKTSILSSLSLISVFLILSCTSLQLQQCDQQYGGTSEAEECREKVLAQQREDEQRKEGRASLQVWEKAGFHITDEAAWIKNHPHSEYTYEIAKEWHNAGWTDADAVISWLDAGWSNPVKARAWYDVVPSGAKASKWHDAGFDLEGTKQWKAKGYDYDTAQQFKTAGLNLTDVTKWHDAGWTDADAVIEWHNAGFNSTEAKQWQNVVLSQVNAEHVQSKQPPTEFKGTEPNTALEKYVAKMEQQEQSNPTCYSYLTKCREHQFSWDTNRPDEEQACHDYKACIKKNSILKVIGEAKSWIKDGFTVGDAKQWHESDFQPDTAKAWRDVGFNPSGATEWLGWISDPVSAKEWIKAGYTAEQADSWMSSTASWVNISVSDAIKVKRTCGKTLHPMTELLKTNPYDVKHKCYFFSGNLLQILSRTRGLYLAGLTTEPFYLDFGSLSASSGSFTGIVKGIGAYQYRNTLRALVITSKFRVVEVINNSND